MVDLVRGRTEPSSIRSKKQKYRLSNSHKKKRRDKYCGLLTHSSNRILHSVSLDK